VAINLSNPHEAFRAHLFWSRRFIVGPGVAGRALDACDQRDDGANAVITRMASVRYPIACGQVQPLLFAGGQHVEEEADQSGYRQSPVQSEEDQRDNQDNAAGCGDDVASPISAGDKFLVVCQLAGAKKSG
jgi:hypothetical protein